MNEATAKKIREIRLRGSGYSLYSQMANWSDKVWFVRTAGYRLNINKFWWEDTWADKFILASSLLKKIKGDNG